MGGGGPSQSAEVIAPFQSRNNAAGAGPASDFTDLRGRPAEVVFVQFELRQWVVLLRVEARRDEDEIRFEVFQLGQNLVRHRRAKRIASGIRRKWNVQDILRDTMFVRRAGARIKR